MSNAREAPCTDCTHFWIWQVVFIQFLISRVISRKVTVKKTRHKWHIWIGNSKTGCSGEPSSDEWIGWCDRGGGGRCRTARMTAFSDTMQKPASWRAQYMMSAYYSAGMGFETRLYTVSSSRILIFIIKTIGQLSFTFLQSSAVTRRSSTDSVRARKSING